MAKVSIRVHSGAARFDVAVVAHSPEQAISLVRERYRNSDVRLKHPTGLERFSSIGGIARRSFSRTDALAA